MVLTLIYELVKGRWKKRTGSKLFSHYRTNTQLVNAQTTYANLLQFEIESKRLLGTNRVHDSTGRLLRQRKKVSQDTFTKLYLTTPFQIIFCDRNYKVVGW